MLKKIRQISQKAISGQQIFDFYFGNLSCLGKIENFPNFEASADKYLLEYDAQKHQTNLKKGYL